MTVAAPHRILGAHRGPWDGQAALLNQVAIPEAIHEAMQAQAAIQTDRQAASQTSTDTGSKALEAREDFQWLVFSFRLGAVSLAAAEICHD